MVAEPHQSEALVPESDNLSFGLVVHSRKHSPYVFKFHIAGKVLNFAGSDEFGAHLVLHQLLRSVVPVLGVLEGVEDFLQRTFEFPLVL